MNFLKRLFGTSAKPATATPTPTTAASKPDDARLVWHLARNERKHVTQIVMTVPKDSESEPRAKGTLMLASKYRSLMEKPTELMAIRMDSDLRPFLCLRADSVVEQFRGCPMRVAFAFYRMEAGGMFMVLLHIDCPPVSARMGVPLVFENGHGLDREENITLLTDLMSRDVVELCFVAGNGPNTLPSSYFGIRFSVPEACRKAMAEEFQKLRDYHRTIPSHRRGSSDERTVQMCYQQWNTENAPQEMAVLNREQ